MKLKTIIFNTIFLISTVFILSSCSKKKNSSLDAPQPTNIKKYEITGNYSGQLSVAYTNASGATESTTVTSLPWTLKLTFAPSVGGMGMGGNSVIGKTGAAGQLVTVKMYSKGVVVQSGNATADANGIINLPGLGYSFQ